MLNPKANGSGHIARNIRLSLLSADLVEPYVSILQVNNVTLPHDVIPLSLSSEDCGTTMAVNANETLDNKLKISFSVGGALSIDQVQLWFASKTDDLVSTASNSSSTCWKQPTVFELQSFSQGTIVGSNSGSGRFSANGPIPAASTTGGILTNGPLFIGTIDIPKGADELIVMASARVDSDWKNGPTEGAGPNIQPQSHMANARTNPNWRHESAGKIVQGRLDWYSQPLTVVVTNNDNDNDNDGNVGPSMAPTSAPSFIVSSEQTLSSSEVPSVSPSVSNPQTLNPTTAVTNRLSDIQSSSEPTRTSGQLSSEPSVHPSKAPTKAPITTDPTERPTDSPTLSPSLSSQVPTPPDEDRSSDPTGSGILSEIPLTPTSPPADDAADDSSASTMTFTSFITIFISLVAAFAA